MAVDVTFERGEQPVRFGFAVGQYRGPLSEPTHRSEVIEFGLKEDVDALLNGEVPERFSWLQPVVDDQMTTGKINKPLRFMAVVGELQVSQASTERNVDYERQVEAMGRLLLDSCDENFNYLGFFLEVETKDGDSHSHQWGRLLLRGGEWWLDSEYPISEVKSAA